ncbi:MAG: hypothetical protein ACI4F3_08110 [Enterocloster sp.]
MKKRMIFFTVSAILVIGGIIIGGIFMYRHFVLDQVMDKGGMEPSISSEVESEEVRAVSENAELVEFSWRQSSMRHDGCFEFRIIPTGQDSADSHLFCCRYVDPETHETIKMGYDEYIVGLQGYGLGQTERIFDSEICPPVPLERWEELADLLRKAELSAYRTPSPGVRDAGDSIIHVTWRDGGEEFSENYDGRSAYDLHLLELLQDIAREVSCKACGKSVASGGRK